MEGLGNSDVAVLIAALNEQEGLGPTVTEIRRFLEKPYVIVVDGNSKDGTVEVARKLGTDVVFQEGKGKGRAIAKGLDCLKEELRFVIFTDADFTYPAEAIPYMIRILEKNPEVGMVCGNRFERPFRISRMKNIFYLGNRLLAFAQYMVNGVDMKDPLTGLRVVRHRILRGWKPKSKGFDIEAELNYLVEKKGYKIREIPIRYRDRLGEKKLKLRHGFRILQRILAESMTG
jgi:glycosyltransferase involved in cell wall biosynthesis